ncbi:MAG: hypothetical protein IKO23_03500 [Bacteroidales bacterium]|nr:hypothetical protein [Bacteroidales bacterium]
MNQRLIKTILLGSLFALGLALGGCHSAPETNIDKIDNLKKQVQTDAKTLSNLETKDFVSLEKDFMACDSMLQYQKEEQVEKSFETLQLVQAYLEQFKVTKPVMQAEIDSTLLQLDRLKADAESHYLSDSLVEVYIDTETEYVNRLSNQVQYFQDRFGSCQKDLNALKKQR